MTETRLNEIELKLAEILKKAARPYLKKREYVVVVLRVLKGVSGSSRVVVYLMNKVPLTPSENRT